MSDIIPYQHSIPRPADPRKRDPLPRMSNMGRKKDKSNTSNTNIPATPLHSTPKKDVKSPKLDKEFKKHKETPPGSRLYPNLEAESNNLDESFTSTFGTESFRSSSETQTTDSLTSDCSYDRRENSPESPINKQYPRYKNQSNEYPRRDGHKESGLSFGISPGYIWGPIFVIGIILTICVQGNFIPMSYEPKKLSETEIIAAKDRLIENIKDLKGLFPSQDHFTWKSFGSGIQDVLTEEHRPAIFLLISSHHETTECLAKRVAQLASRTLGGTGNNVILTPDNFKNNKSKVFELMEDRMNQTKAVVVPDLLSMQPEAIKAFHDICDPYNPLIAEAVYLLTIKSRTNVESKDLAKFVNKQLRQIFLPVIKEDTLEALVTRITAGALLVIKEEKDIPCSQ